MPESRSNEFNDIKLLLLISATLLSTGICIAAIVLTSINGFALYNLGVILSFAFTAILSVAELLRHRDEQQSSGQRLLARVLAFLSTLMLALTAIAIILLSGDFASGIIVTTLTGIVACWTATIFNDTQKTSKHDFIPRKKSPWPLIISNLLILSVSLAAQITTLVLVHQASLAYIFTISGFNLALTIPILFLSCRGNTFKGNSWPLVIIGIIVSGLFIAGASLCEFHNGLSIFADLGAIFSTLVTFGGFLYALSHSCGKNKVEDTTSRVGGLNYLSMPHQIHDDGYSAANTASLNPTATPPQIITHEGDVLVGSYQGQSISRTSTVL